MCMYVYIYIYMYNLIWSIYWQKPFAILVTNTWRNLRSGPGASGWTLQQQASQGWVFFFHPGPVWPDPKGLSMFIIIGTKPKHCEKTVYQCLSFINVWLVTEHTNKTAVQLVDVYCSHFWTKPCGSTKLKRGSWKNDVIQKNHRFLMTRPWHLCSSLEVSVRWQWGAPL